MPPAGFWADCIIATRAVSGQTTAFFISESGELCPYIFSNDDSKKEVAIFSCPISFSYSGMLDYMVNHCAEPLRISEIAWKNGISQSHLNAMFRRETGTGTEEHLTAIRMAHP